MINKDNLKNSLTIDDVKRLVDTLDGAAIINSDTLICKTICHCGSHHKLYYYGNTKLFKCFTECNDTFDIFSLVQRVKKFSNLYDSIKYVASFFGYIESQKIESSTIEDWKILDKYLDSENFTEQKIELKYFDDSVLSNFPFVRIKHWEKEGISFNSILKHNIRYNPDNQSIIIPHYDKDNNLIGIRDRTLVKEEEIYGKYKPAIINGVMYNHPLSFNLYNLNNSKNNIKNMKVAIVFEGEKSPLKFSSFFGKNNDLSVAVCGSSLISYQVKLLINCGVKEIVIAFDKQFQTIGDDEFKKWTKKLEDIYKKYSAYADITFLFDKWNLLDYKDSPIDKGKDTFLKLFEKRIRL